MQHYSLSAEISGLEVRALPGSPAPCGPWMVRFLATTTERSVAPTRNHRNSAHPSNRLCRWSSYWFNCCRQSSVETSHGRTDCTVCANRTERMVCNAARALDL